MKNRLIVWLVLGISPLMVSYASSAATLVLDPVGPQPESTPKGYLKVYTATQKHDDGGTQYFTHSNYIIYSKDGKTVVKKVPNAINIHDEDPSLVQLPVGKYVVLAQAKYCGTVRIPTIIKTGQLTTVDLENDWKYRLLLGNTADLVRLHNGQIVGWRADISANADK